VDENSHSLQASIWQSLRISRKMVKDGNWFSYLLRDEYVTGAAMALRKELVASVLTIPNPWLHDEWLAFAAAMQDGLVAYPKVLFFYRQHNKNVMGMKQLGFGERVERWKNSLILIQDTRRKKICFYQDIEREFLKELTEKQHKSLSQCISFLEECQTLRRKKIGKRFLIVMHNVLNLRYYRFTSGFFSVLRDITCGFLTSKESI
jgi:hypothetical protein